MRYRATLRFSGSVIPHPTTLPFDERGAMELWSGDPQELYERVAQDVYLRSRRRRPASGPNGEPGTWHVVIEDRVEDRYALVYGDRPSIRPRPLRWSDKSLPDAEEWARKQMTRGE